MCFLISKKYRKYSLWRVRAEAMQSALFAAALATAWQRTIRLHSWWLFSFSSPASRLSSGINSGKCGLWDKKLHHQLFTKKKPTFKEAFKEALTAEAAGQVTREVCQLQSPASPKKGNQSIARAARATGGGGLHDEGHRS